jgi:hypothetical protein
MGWRSRPGATRAFAICSPSLCDAARKEGREISDDNDVDRDPSDWNGWLEHRFGRHQSVTEFVGLSEAQARDAATALGVEKVRVIVLDRPREEGKHYRLSADRRPARLNLAIVEGRVVRAAYF